MRAPSLGRLLLAAATVLVLSPGRVPASDHGDTAENVNRIGADMTDVYIFPSVENDANVVLVMDVHGLIPAGQTASFDPGVLYQIKIDTTGDFVEDVVIQAKFSGMGPGQTVAIAGPMKPPTTGTTAIFGRRNPTLGMINETFQPDAARKPDMKVFAGLRSDPFFFDVEQFYKIFPDRMTPLTGKYVDLGSIMDANTPMAPGFRPPGEAMDFFTDLNCLSVIVEMPRAALGGGTIGVWETTSVFSNSDFRYHQQDRLARPVVNEALATVTNRRHRVNNRDNPTDDNGQLKKDIEAFLTFPAGRSRAIKNVIEAVLVPDVQVADLSQTNVPAAYLGVETLGATGSKFGGRALANDVVDISLMVVFGNTIPALGLAPDDGNELPPFTTDNIGPHQDYQNVFPYLGNPH